MALHLTITQRPAAPHRLLADGQIVQRQQLSRARQALLDLPEQDLLRCIEDALVERYDVSSSAILGLIDKLAELPQLTAVMQVRAPR